MHLKSVLFVCVISVAFSHGITFDKLYADGGYVAEDVAELWKDKVGADAAAAGAAAAGKAAAVESAAATKSAALAGAADLLALQKAAAVKAGLINLIKAKLTPKGIADDAIAKDAAIGAGFAFPGAALLGQSYGFGLPGAAFAGDALLNEGKKAALAAGAITAAASAASTAAKTKNLLALLAGLALAKKGLKTVADEKLAKLNGAALAVQPATLLSAQLSAQPAAVVSKAPELYGGYGDYEGGYPGGYITTGPAIAGIKGGWAGAAYKDDILADKKLIATGAAILKSLLVKLGIAGAGKATVDTILKKIQAKGDDEVIPLLFTAGLLEDHGWIPDGFVKEGLKFWGQVLPHMSEPVKAKLAALFKWP